MRLDITITSDGSHKLFEFTVGIGIISFIKSLFSRKVEAPEALPDPVYPHEMGFGG
jgi:hypothetical protein